VKSRAEVVFYRSWSFPFSCLRNLTSLPPPPPQWVEKNVVTPKSPPLLVPFGDYPLLIFWINHPLDARYLLTLVRPGSSLPPPVHVHQFDGRPFSSFQVRTHCEKNPLLVRRPINRSILFQAVFFMVPIHCTPLFASASSLREIHLIFFVRCRACRARRRLPGPLPPDIWRSGTYIDAPAWCFLSLAPLRPNTFPCGLFLSSGAFSIQPPLISAWGSPPPKPPLLLISPLFFFLSSIPPAVVQPLRVVG